MAVFKCKMCGGTIEFEPGATVGVCDSCGTKQTLPRLDDEKRANLYDRANHFRRNNEFDKAAGIYEQILNEDTTDAEAYWSLVLCRYGVEYVEDPSSHQRIPTVNRTQFTSIFDDDNYKSALQYADGYQKSIYEEEANSINEIQKGILAISQKEEPFDVFICYKETDNNGGRTQDSVLANDLYHQLTNEGFKVFFSRITLEDKLGTAYEPYIFAALNSAKVMVVVGTKPEHFNAVWVKNEWSRYLALIKSGANKTLIPAYRDMDPYDLPEEFSHLQAQDMSKLGFMQDLIRGIKKIVSDTAATPAKSEVPAAGNAGLARMLKNGETYVSLQNWAAAIEAYQAVTKEYPESYQGWWGLIVAHTQNFEGKPSATLEQLEEWFAYVQRLSDEETLWKMGKQFSLLIADQETNHISITLETYSSEEAAYEEKKKQALQRKFAAEREMDNKIRNIEKDVEREESIISGAQARKKSANRFEIIGTLFFVAGLILVIRSIVIGQTTIPWISLTMGIIGFLIATIYSDKSSQHSKSIKEATSAMTTQNAEKEKLQTETQNKVSACNKEIAENEKKISQVKGKIEKVNSYLELGKQQIADYWATVLYNKYGMDCEVPEDIEDLRCKALGLRKENVRELPDTSRYSVTLVSAGSDRQTKMSVGGVIMEVASLNYEEVLTLLDNTPTIIEKSLLREQAEELKQKLEAKGAKVEIAKE